MLGLHFCFVFVSLGPPVCAGEVWVGEGLSWFLGLLQVSHRGSGFSLNGASPGFGSSVGLSLSFWSFIELFALVMSMIGLFLFHMGLEVWIVEALLLV